MSKKHGKRKLLIQLFAMQLQLIQAQLGIMKLEKNVNDISNTILDEIIDNPLKLHAATGLIPNEFEWLVKQFKRYIVKAKNCPRFSGYTNGRGNTCKLNIQQFLLVVLWDLRSDLKQQDQASICRVNQSTISRYLEIGDEFLYQETPNAERISKMMENAKTKKAIKIFLPGRGGGELAMDITEVGIERPGKNQSRFFSGKKRRHTYSIQMVINKDGLALNVSDAYAGRKHDFKIFKKHIPKFERWCRWLFDPNIPDKEKIIILMDLGYLGAEEFLPGAKVRLPIKKLPGETLTVTEQEYNQLIRRLRIGVEHKFAHIKNYRKLRAVYRGSIKQFYRHFQIVTGLQNLHILFKKKKYAGLIDKICP